MALYLKQLDDSFVRRLAQEFLESYMTMAKLAKKYNSSAGTVSEILYNGIVNGVIDDITTEAVIAKVIDLSYDTYQTANRWNKARLLRQSKLDKKELKLLKRKLEELEFQYDSYEDNVFEDSCPSKDDLYFEILEIKEQIARIKNSKN